MELLFNRINWLIWLLIFLNSCSTPKEPENTVSSEVYTHNRDGIFLENKCLFFDADTLMVYEESSGKLILPEAMLVDNSIYWEERERIIMEIKNSSITDIRCCYDSNKFLSMGEVVFLLVNRMEPIPIARYFGVQFDHGNLNCPYPVGLNEFVAKNRALVVDSLMIRDVGF